MSENVWHMHEPLGIGHKLDKDLDHQGRKENKTTSATDPRNELGEVVELEMKGSVFGITSKSWESISDASRVSVCERLTHCDSPVKTLWSDGDNNVLTSALQHHRTGDNERVLPGLLIGPPVLESLL